MVPTIVTLTLNPALDGSTITERLVPEQKLRCEALALDAGGGGINVSKGIQELGGHSIAVFPQGGHNGALICGLLQERGIEARTVTSAVETRENLSVVESSTGQQFRFTFNSLPLELSEGIACLEQVALLKPDILVGSGSLPEGLPVDFYRQVAKTAQDCGARFFLDTSGEALAAGAGAGVYLLKPNLPELCKLVGVTSLEINEIDDAALQLIQEGRCEVVVVSMGPQGALLVTGSEVFHVPAPMVHKVSTVGAGDSMVAGMVWSATQYDDPVRMVQMGVACGSAATLNAGSQLFRLADVNRLFAWVTTTGFQQRVTRFD
jgi:6-phosphofructokinase 2